MVTHSFPCPVFLTSTHFDPFASTVVLVGISKRLEFNLCYPSARRSTCVFSTNQLQDAGMLLIFQEAYEKVCSNVVLQQTANPL
jgi:hypothetical protein